MKIYTGDRKKIGMLISCFNIPVDIVPQDFGWDSAQDKTFSIKALVN